MEAGKKLENFCRGILEEVKEKKMSANPLVSKEGLLAQIDPVFQLSLDRFSEFPPIPEISTVYNPFVKFEDAPKLIKYQRLITELPDYWMDLIDLFERILTPEIRTWLYNKIAPFMPNLKESGRGWYSSRRESGVFTRLFAEKYKRDEFYARIFPVLRELPKKAPEIILPSGKIKKVKPPKETCSTITVCERNFKIMCCYLLNGLMEEQRIKLQLVEIDIVSCHARVLCYLFPNRTPLLSAVFREERNLWGETISYIPSHIAEVMSKTSSPKKLVKIVAYKTLQSGLVSHKSILKAIKDSIYELSEEDQSTVVETLRNNPVLAEFRTLFKEVGRRADVDNLRVYSVFQEHPLEFKRVSEEENSSPKREQVEVKGSRGYSSNPFRFCSSVLVGVEMLILCGIVRTLSQHRIGLPINLEHDGCLCLIDISKGPLDIDRMNSHFSKILYEATSISNMKLEVKHLDFS